jgi:hypothetical protein
MPQVVSIIQGNILVSTATFTDTASGDPVDPDAVLYGWRIVGGTDERTWTDYLGSDTPAVGVVARTGTGVYVFWLDLTDLSGVLSWIWQSTGTGQAAADGLVQIPALPQ